MFANQRLNIIRQVLLKENQVDNASLASLLHVSEVTIRKDLATLESEGFLKRVHGGAILSIPQATPEPSPLVSQADSPLNRLADLALTLINDFDNLYLGAEPVCLALATKLYQRKNLTVLTNNVSALPYLDPSIHNLFFIGGTVSRYGEIEFTHGQKALSFLDGIFINKAFIGADGIDLQFGVTSNLLSLKELYSKILSSSKLHILMATHEIFGQTAMQQIDSIETFQTIVTEHTIPDEYKNYCFSKNIKLLTSFHL